MPTVHVEPIEVEIPMDPSPRSNALNHTKEVMSDEYYFVGCWNLYWNAFPPRLLDMLYVAIYHTARFIVIVGGVVGLQLS